MLGAEAISINDKRISNMSAIKLVGNFIMVNEQKIVAPYSIKAIGSQEYLESALTIKGGYVDILRKSGIEVTITKENNLLINKYDKDMNLKYMD